MRKGDDLLKVNRSERVREVQEDQNNTLEVNIIFFDPV